MWHAQGVEGKHGAAKSTRAGQNLTPTQAQNPFLAYIHRLCNLEAEQSKVIMGDLVKYLKRGQVYSDAYQKHVEKSLTRISTNRLGEFSIEVGDTVDGGQLWRVTIAVVNREPVRVLFCDGHDLSYTLNEFKSKLSTEEPKVGLEVTHSRFGSGRVTGVEMMYNLVHNCTVYLDLSKKIATRPSICDCGFHMRTRFPCDGLNFVYSHQKIPLTERSLVNPEWDLSLHPWATRACEGMGCVPPGMPSTYIASGGVESVGLFTIPMEALTREVDNLKSLTGGDPKTKRYHMIHDVFQAVVPLAKVSDDRCARMILALRAFKEFVTSNCEPSGNSIPLDGVAIPTFNTSGMQSSTAHKAIHKKRASTTDTAQGLAPRKRSRGVCSLCKPFGVRKGMEDPADPVLCHTQGSCFFKHPYDPDNGKWPVSYAAELPRDWQRSSPVAAMFPDSRMSAFFVPLRRYPHAKPGDVFRVIGLNWVVSEVELIQSTYLGSHELPKPSQLGP